MKVTFDTNIFPIDDLLRLTDQHSFDIATVSVTGRELQNTDKQIPVIQIDETALWDESGLDSSQWASEDNNLETILAIISNGSFPNGTSPENLTVGQRTNCVMQ